MNSTGAVTFPAEPHQAISTVPRGLARARPHVVARARRKAIPTRIPAEETQEQEQEEEREQGAGANPFFAARSWRRIWRRPPRHPAETKAEMSTGGADDAEQDDEELDGVVTAQTSQTAEVVGRVVAIRSGSTRALVSLPRAGQDETMQRAEEDVARVVVVYVVVTEATPRQRLRIEPSARITPIQPPRPARHRRHPHRLPRIVLRPRSARVVVLAALLFGILLGVLVACWWSARAAGSDERLARMPLASIETLCGLELELHTPPLPRTTSPFYCALSASRSPVSTDI